MVKKISMLALAGLIALPTLATAGGGRNAAALEQKIDELSRQLDELKAQMAKQNETITETSGKVDDMDTMLEEKSEKWDLASRFQFDGDFRARGDYYKASSLFEGGDQENDTILTNRFRLNMRVKATEDLEFKGRLAMYKAWGMQTFPTNSISDIPPIFDGNTTRTPDNSALYVDRAFVNWNNIGGAPVWFSIGRRPTSDGPPAQLRMNNDNRMATPVAYMDYPFDGLSLGYGYNWGNDALGSGRIRFCYGRGFENGIQDKTTNLDDTDFAGFSWDVMQKGSRFLNIQTFGVYNLYNVPEFESDLYNMAYAGQQKDLGQLYHTSGVFMDKINNLNYFFAGAWSHTDPNGNGIFNELSPLGLIPNTDTEDGYSFYTGIRYDIDNIGLKLGAEYNHGSQYWIAFAPGHDDLYRSKLATRGNAYELYMIYDLPTGEAISKYAKTFMRLGWQYYDYNYYGSGDYNVKPYDLDDDKELLRAYGMNPIENANQVYITFEAYF